MGILRTDKVSGLETPTAVTNSVLFDGNDYLSIAEVPELKLGTTDFTIEAWINFGADVSNEHQNIIAAGNPESANSFVIQILSDDTANTARCLDFRTDTRSDTSSTSIPLNEWTHIAVTKESNVVKLFVNGTQENSGTEAESLTTAITAIGYRSASSYGYVNGYISNLRVIKGRALYTADFTVPVHALEPIGGTVLLCCNNSDSVTAASYAGIGTSVTLTANGDPTVSTVNPGLTRDFTFGTEFQGVTIFDTQGYFVPPSGTTEQRGRGRGLFMGGYAPGSYKSGIDAIQIQSLGNSITFGNLSDAANAEGTSVASSTRAVKGGRASGGNHIEYVTIATTGNAIDFGGDLTSARRSLTGVSNGSRGVFCGGAPTIVNIMDYITIASAGVNAADFGDLTVARRSLAAASSPTRGVVGGGNANPANSDVIDYITIASTGNAIDFGNLTAGRRELGGCSSSTRGVFACGYKDPGATTGEIDYITIASTGNAQDFGDSVLARSGVQGTSNSIRGIFKGGSTPTYQNIIEYVTIATTGNSADFGDGTANAAAGIIHYGGCSDSHGGIS